MFPRWNANVYNLNRNSETVVNPAKKYKIPDGSDVTRGPAPLPLFPLKTLLNNLEHNRGLQSCEPAGSRSNWKQNDIQ